MCSWRLPERIPVSGKLATGAVEFTTYRALINRRARRQLKALNNCAKPIAKQVDIPSGQHCRLVFRALQGSKQTSCTVTSVCVVSSEAAQQACQYIWPSNCFHALSSETAGGKRGMLAYDCRLKH